MSEWLCRRYNNGDFPFNNSVTFKFAWWLHQKTCWDIREGEKYWH